MAVSTETIVNKSELLLKSGMPGTPQVRAMVAKQVKRDIFRAVAVVLGA